MPRRARESAPLNAGVSTQIELTIYKPTFQLSSSCMVAQIEFTEWTPDGHLRHSKFVGLREDKEAGEVVREGRV